MKFLLSTIITIILLFLVFLPRLANTNESAKTAATHPAPIIEPVFTPEEQNWLEKKQEIWYVYDPDWAPFEWRNDIGMHTGIIADILNIIENKTGIHFVPIHADTWAESVELVKSHKADMFSAITQNSDREQYLNFTSKNIYSYPAVLVTQFDDKTVYLDIDHDFKNKKIGLIKSSGLGNYITEKYPELDYVELPSTMEGFLALRKNKIDLFAINTVTARHFIEKKGFANLKIAIKLDYTYHLKIATHKKLPKQVISILDKSLIYIKKDQLNDIFNKWTEVSIEKRIDWKFVIQIVSVLGLMLLFFIWNTRRLNLIVGHKTKDLKNEIERRKRIEESLIQAKDEAIRSNRTKSDFLANMSHDIRTPMNGIIGMTRLALDTKLTSDQRVYLENVRYSADGLLRLLNDILDLSKIEAGQLLMESNDFSVPSMVDHIISMMTFAAEEKGLELILQYDSSDLPVFVKGDELRLRQILVNLIGNSIKFTGKGSVTLKVIPENREDNKVELHFKVIDTGIGIPADKKETIFSSFSQADASTTRKFGGTGLGLAISKQLVEMMGGRIWCESSEGQGSQFHFIVVLEHGDEQNVKQHLDVIGSTLKELTILLMEDHQINRDLLRMVLEQDNHQVIEVENGLKGLEVLVEQDVDLILMDVQMPVMDGLTASEIIRASENDSNLSHFNLSPFLSEKLIQQCKGRHIPIIAMTANAMEGDKEKCLKAGMDNYLTKPFDPAQVKALIAHI